MATMTKAEQKLALRVAAALRKSATVMEEWLFLYGKDYRIDGDARDRLIGDMAQFAKLLEAQYGGER